MSGKQNFRSLESRTFSGPTSYIPVISSFVLVHIIINKSLTVAQFKQNQVLMYGMFSKVLACLFHIYTDVWFNLVYSVFFLFCFFLSQHVVPCSPPNRFPTAFFQGKLKGINTLSTVFQNIKLFIEKH